MTRHIWVRVHRYAGLYMAFFLVVAGLTGSLLAFYHELDAWLNPHLYTVRALPGQTVLDPYALRARAEALAPQGRVDEVSFAPRAPDAAFETRVKPRIDPATSRPYELEFDRLFLDPYTGALLGKRLWGEMSLAPEKLMPFLYRLHYQLALPGSIGTWLFGIAALIWTLDCFVGFYLTLPRRKSPSVPLFQRGKKIPIEKDATVIPPFEKGGQGGFLARWKPAWQVKRSRVNYDLHRAAGLWTWAMLFVFAWSAVYFNLGDQVYRPVMGLLFTMEGDVGARPARPLPPEFAADWRAAHATGQHLMAAQAVRHGFVIEREARLRLDRAQGVYRYWVRSSRDIGESDARTMIVFDAASGAPVSSGALSLPSGRYAGDTVTRWLAALHMARVFGLPMQIFVSAMGVVVVALSITGVVIWWRKRRVAKNKRPHTAATRRIGGLRLLPDPP